MRVICGLILRVVGRESEEERVRSRERERVVRVVVSCERFKRYLGR